jgi:hypothetical protein
LKPTICSKFSAVLTKGFVTHHDSSPSHTAVRTLEMIQKLKFRPLPYTTFKPDLDPFDYQNFGFHKNVIIWMPICKE